MTLVTKITNIQTFANITGRTVFYKNPQNLSYQKCPRMRNHIMLRREARKIDRLPV